jgi:hypothetical protein
MVNAPGGRLMLLQYAIEEMQECMGRLSENPPFVRAVFSALDNAGMLTPERLDKRSKIVEEKVACCEPPFDRPFMLADPDDPHNWEKAVFWPAQARAMKAMDEGVFIPSK